MEQSFKARRISMRYWAFFKAMSFFVVCLICNACSWLAEDPGVNVNWQNVQIMNKSGEKIYALDFMFYDSTLLTPQHVFELFDGKLLIETENDSSFIGKIPIPDNDLEANDKYQVIIFKQSTLDKYSKEEIIKQNIFDKRYELSYNELKKVNFKMTYSGD